MIETEIPVKVIDVQGVSNQTLAEDLPDQYCSSLQNLYERVLGELHRKGGTSQITTTFPVQTAVSSVAGLDNALILRKKFGNKIHVQAVHTNQTNAEMNPATYVNLATPSFVTATGGNWGTAIGSPANTRLDSNGYCQLQYVGFGTNFTVEHAVTRGANNTLRVTVPANIDSRILGINVYVSVEVWTGTPTEQTVWVGYIDLNASGTRGTTYDFTQAPITNYANPGVTGVMFGAPTKPNFTVEGYTGGSLTPGKTYYVSVLEQYFSSGSGTTTRASAFRARESTLQSVTLRPGETSIRVTPAAAPPGDSACYCIAVGEHPQLMQPVFITNVFATTSDSNFIYSLPLASPNLCGITPYDATYSDYIWRYCDCSQTDMFFRYSASAANGTLPIYVSRTTIVNKAVYETATDFMNRVATVENTFSSIVFRTVDMSSGARYCFQQLGDVAFIVNNASEIEGVTPGSLSDSFELYRGIYLITDGTICGQVVFDFGTTAPPKCNFITAFQESIIIGGGPSESEGYNNIYCSNAYNPANFSDSGSGANLAFIGLETAGEPVMGMGIFSITTADSGINTQLIVGSRTKLFKLNSIPAAADFGSAYLDQLSNKVGLASHWTLVNTEIGTILTGLDDVYLIRDSGEPTPIGQDISGFISPVNKTLGIDTSYWNAVYHDGHYKLAYSVPGATAPTREVWLNIKKMKANKGKPSWYGPHTGRTVSYSIVDEVLAQSDIEKRIIINVDADRNDYADSPAYYTDLGVNIPTVFEKEIVGDGGQFANKKLIRFQVRGRVTSQINAIAKIYADGTLISTQVERWVPKMNVTDIIGQATQVFPAFPVQRSRGRIIKLRLETDTQERFGISGLLLGVKAERRRI